MMRPWRPLAFAAAFTVIVGAGAASAQTVIVRSAPPGANIELVLNTTSAGSAAANAGGDATIPFDAGLQGAKPEMDAFIFVELCGERRRVLIVERSSQGPPEEADCERRDIPGLFLVRRNSTIVVNIGSANPTVLLVQGRYDLNPSGPGRFWSGTPTGVVLFGGAGLTRFSDAGLVFCGEVSPCERDDSGLGFAAGLGYWFSPYVAVEGSYTRPAKAEANGSGTDFRFNSFLDAYTISAVGKIGVPAGAVRVYGQVGTIYTNATFGTTQTHDDRTVTIDGVEQTIEGGSQNLELKTSGWGWTFGGGVEAWFTRSFGMYAEVSRSGLKGSAADDEEGTMDDSLTAIMLGVRIHLGR